MRWAQHKELSEADLDLLIGSAVLTKMMSHKLIVKYHDGEKAATPKEMGLRDCKGLFHMREVDSIYTVYEILFELSEDRDMVEEHLTQYKLSLD